MSEHRRQLVVREPAGHLCRWLRAVFAGHDVRVVETRTRNSCLEAADGSRPIAVLLDEQELSDASTELVDAVRQRHGSARVIVLYASGAPALVQATVEAGAALAMRKPVSLRRLAHILKRLLPVPSLLASGGRASRRRKPPLNVP